MPSGWSWGDGSKATNPAPFSFVGVKAWLQATNLPDFTLYWYSGNYVIFNPDQPWSSEHQFRIQGDSNRVVRLIGIPATNGALPKLILRAEPPNSTLMTTYVAKWPPTSTIHHTLIATAAYTLPGQNTLYLDAIGMYHEYLNRIEIENLELDGNFDGHAPLTTAANPTGYKSAALDLWARTGRIKNVKVRNFGSVGQVPYSLVEADSAGTEAFPVRFTTFDDAKGSTPDPAPWFLENVEVSHFRSVHGGYGTMFLGSVNTTNANTASQAPIALFRGCMVNGGTGTLAFGAAGQQYGYLTNLADPTNPAAYPTRGFYTSLSRHEACMVLNGGAVFNTDTGAIRDFRMRNGIYLDVLNVGYLGTPSQTLASHVNFEFNTNLVRLRGRRSAPTYTEFYINSLSDWGTDPNRALGRHVTNFADGLTFQGVAKDISFVGNWITTWPAEGFLTSNPSSTNESVFRLLWPIRSDVWYNDTYFARTRHLAQNVTLSDNFLSLNAFEFGGSNALGDHTLASLQTNSPPAYTDPRLALTQLPSGFKPEGRVERILPSWSGTNLTGASEVAFGQTYVTNGTNLVVTLRAVSYRTAASGNRRTLPLNNVNLLLAAELNPKGGGTNLLGMFAINTTNTGIITQTINLGTNDSASVRLTAWIAGIGGVTNFDAAVRAWASHDVSVGSVVQVTALPDVGDDRNTSSAKRAILRFTRTGTPGALSNTLAVSFRLPTNGAPDLVSPVDARNLLATYGTSGSADYHFGTTTGGSLSTIVPGGINTVTFNTNSTEVQVPIVTRVDSLTEANVVRIELLPAASYALGASTRADIMVYDGPFWSLVELGAVQNPTALSMAYGLNNGVTDGSGNITVQPRVVGTATYYDPVYLLYHPNGGTWMYPQLSLTPLSSTLVPHAVAFRANSNDVAWVAGYSGNLARIGREDGSSWSSLPHAGTNFNVSKAFALSANSSNIAGLSRISGVDRAVAWFNRGAPQDLAAGAGNGPGRALGINNAGVVIGQASLMFGQITNLYNRPFRTAGGTAGIVDQGDILQTPSTNGVGAALAVNTNGVTVGWYQTSTNSAYTLATLWNARIAGTPNGMGIELGFWFPPWQIPETSTHKVSQATSLNDIGGIVGWSGPTNTATVAVYRPDTGAKWQDLNDRHFVAYPPGWILLHANGVNNQRLIIGNGTLFGTARGFVLVPREPGN